MYMHLSSQERARSRRGDRKGEGGLLVIRLLVCVCMCVCVCVYVCTCGREREKALSGSCAVWMMRPMSAACQDVASYVRYPSSYECDFVCVCGWMGGCVQQLHVYGIEEV